MGIAFLLLIPSVYATEYEEGLIEKIAPNGKATLKMIQPKGAIEAEFTLTASLNKLIGDDNYLAYAYSCNDTYTKCNIVIDNIDPNFSGDVQFSKVYEDIIIDYVEPSKESQKLVSDYYNKLKDFDDADITTYYSVEDMNLINYYLTSNKSELWNPGASNRALRYSKDMINITKGNSLTFNLNVRAGMQDDDLMYESAFGGMTVFYNGYAYFQKTQGLYLRRIIYIPSDTADTKEAYINAAQKRINDYVGNETVEVTYGGLLSSLDSEAIDEASVATNTTDGNYYNIKIKNRIYKFYIIKGTSEQLVNPTYISNNIDYNIKISSTDSSIPLDTSLSATKVKNNTLKKTLGTENYYAYDLNLFSDGSNSYIRKLENGKFLVSIPIPSGLDVSKINIYYVKDDGTKEIYKHKINGNFVEFETDHFSTYALAEGTNEKVDNPSTGDSILLYVVISFMSLIGLICSTLYTRKRMLK